MLIYIVTKSPAVSDGGKYNRQKPQLNPVSPSTLDRSPLLSSSPGFMLPYVIYPSSIGNMLSPLVRSGLTTWSTHYALTQVICSFKGPAKRTVMALTELCLLIACSSSCVSHLGYSGNSNEQPLVLNSELSSGKQPGEKENNGSDLTFPMLRLLSSKAQGPKHF